MCRVCSDAQLVSRFFAAPFCTNIFGWAIEQSPGPFARARDNTILQRAFEPPLCCFFLNSRALSIKMQVKTAPARNDLHTTPQLLRSYLSDAASQALASEFDSPGLPNDHHL